MSGGGGGIRQLQTSRDFSVINISEYDSVVSGISVEPELWNQNYR